MRWWKWRLFDRLDGVEQIRPGRCGPVDGLSYQRIQIVRYVLILVLAEVSRPQARRVDLDNRPGDVFVKGPEVHARLDSQNVDRLGVQTNCMQN